jgi:hypothetical protein
MSINPGDINRSHLIDCIFAFAASAIVTLIVCAVTPEQPIAARYRGVTKPLVGDTPIPTSGIVV